MNCIYCKNKTKKYIKSKDYNRKICETHFEYYKCKNCGVVQLNNIPKNLGMYYPADYYGPTPINVESLKNAAELLESYKIELVGNYCKNIKTILEIGPSMGGFSVLAKDRGYNVRSIELNSECSRFLNDVADIPTVNTQDEISSIKSEKPVDLIAMWHVIEHVPKPFLLLTECLKKINKNGYILLAAPNPDSIQFNFFKSRWVHLDAPRHINLLPLGVLNEFFEEHGFEVVLFTTTDEGSIKWDEFGWLYSFKNIVGDKWSPTFAKWTQRFFSNKESQQGQGCCYTIIAKKI